MTNVQRALLVGVLAAAGCINGCSGEGPKPTTPPAVSSPDGSLSLVTTIGMDKADTETLHRVKIEILDSDGQVVFSEWTAVFDMYEWHAEWVDNDRICIRSSEFGDLYWQRTGGVWQRAS